MTLRNVEAVVLAAEDSGDFDRRLSLLTPDQGRLFARAAGVRRPGARLAAAAQPTVHARFRLWLPEGSAGGRVAGGVLMDGHPALRRDWRRQTAAAALCEWTDRFAPLRQPAGEKFELLTRALSAMEREDPARVRAAFLVQFARLAGYGLGGDARCAALDAWDFSSPAAFPDGAVSGAEARVLQCMTPLLGRPLRAWAHGRALERFRARPPAAGARP